MVLARDTGPLVRKDGRVIRCKTPCENRNVGPPHRWGRLHEPPIARHDVFRRVAFNEPSFELGQNPGTRANPASRLNSRDKGFEISAARDDPIGRDSLETP